MPRFIAKAGIDRLRRRILAKKPDRVVGEQLFALAIAEHVFGREWLKANLWGSDFIEEFGSESRRPYLQSLTGGEQHVMRSHFRLCEAMGFVLRYQFEPHARRIMEAMERCGLEETITELRVADLLSHWGLKFRFRSPYGIKGMDYDLDIELPNGAFVAGEIKCKVSETELSEKSIVRTLVKAKGQLPTDRACVLFLQVPETWMMSYSEGGQIVRDAIGKFLKSTTKINTVVEMLNYSPDQIDGSEPCRIFAERFNERCPFGNLGLVDYDRARSTEGINHELHRRLWTPDQKRLCLGDLQMLHEGMPPALERYCGW